MLKKESYRKFFQKSHILLLGNEYLLGLITFRIDNLEMFQTNSAVHAVNTRHKYLHRPDVKTFNLTYLKGVCYSGIKLYNKILFQIKSLSANRKQYKWVLKKFLLTHTFTPLEKFILLRCDYGL